MALSSVEVCEDLKTCPGTQARDNGCPPTTQSLRTLLQVSDQDYADCKLWIHDRHGNYFVVLSHKDDRDTSETCLFLISS